MNRICLVALIGLPALGKTTLCQYLINYEALPFNTLHLCYDNFIQFNPGNPTDYQKQRDLLLKYVAKIVNSLKTVGNLLPEDEPLIECQYKNPNSNDVVILCDDNHYYRSMRYKLFQIAQKYNISFCQIYMENILQLALERNKLRTGKSYIPHEVLLEMYKRLEPPNAIQHKWEENTLVLKKYNSIKHLSLKVVSYITNILYNPVQPSIILNKTINLTPQSIAHELDLLIRKRISEIMAATEETNNKHLLAKQLNDRRKHILKEFKLKLHDKQNDNIDLDKYVDMLY